LVLVPERLLIESSRWTAVWTTTGWLRRTAAPGTNFSVSGYSKIEYTSLTSE
jgi:hypothetical protein